MRIFTSLQIQYIQNLDSAQRKNAMGIGHLSPSQVNMLLRCPTQWYFRYVENKVIQPTGSMMVGSAFHGAVGINYSQKIETHEDLPLQEVLDYFSTDFDANSQETDWRHDDPGTKKDTGIQTLSKYQESIAPLVQPKAVELGYQLSFTNVDWTFKGYVDLVTDAEVVLELKTSARSVSKPREDHIRQISAYILGNRQLSGAKEFGARIDYAIHPSKNNPPKIVSFTIQDPDDLVFHYLKLIKQCSRIVENEVFIPNRDHILCSRKWCGYWELCEKAWSGKVKE